MKPFVTQLGCIGHILLLCIALSACTSEELPPANAYEHAVGGSYSATLSADGNYSIISSTYHGLVVWDNQKQGLKYQWRHQENEDSLALICAISPDNNFVLTADAENFSLWDMETGESAGFIKIKDSRIRDMALSNNAQHILVGKSNGVVVHIETASGRRIEFLGHQEKINSVDISPNGRYALTGSNDYVAYLWDTQSGQVIHRFNHPSRVTKVALDPQGRYAFTADSQRQAQIWDLTTGEAISRLRYTSRQMVFSTVRFNQDGSLLATGSPSRKLNLWDVKSGERLQSWTVAPRKHSRPKGAVVHSVAFVNNDTQLLTESSSGLMERWDIDFR